MCIRDRDLFLRVNKYYIVNTRHIDSFDNNDIYIGNYEIAIGNSYRDTCLLYTSRCV